MKNPTPIFDEALLRKQIADFALQESEGDKEFKLNWEDYETIDRLLYYLNEQEHVVAFDKMSSSVSSDYGSATIIATVYAVSLGKSILLEWDMPENYEGGEDEFVNFVRTLYQDALEILTKLNTIEK